MVLFVTSRSPEISHGMDAVAQSHWTTSDAGAARCLCVGDPKKNEWIAQSLEGHSSTVSHMLPFLTLVTTLNPRQHCSKFFIIMSIAPKCALLQVKSSSIPPCCQTLLSTSSFAVERKINV